MQEPIVAQKPVDGDGATDAVNVGTNARPGRIGLIAVIVVWASVLVRVLTLPTDSDARLAYVAGFSAFLVIAVALWRRRLPTTLLHVVFALQSAIVLVLFALDPERDIVTGLLALQCYEAAVVFTGRTRLTWVAGLVALIGASLVAELGLVRGLSLALIPMVAGIVLSTYVVVSRELEAARATSHRMVADLQAAQRRLEEYAGQVDELAAIEERSRVAEELQESVSSTLSEVLSVTHSAQLLLDDPEKAGVELERLQSLTKRALAQMRRVITELRPASAEAPAGDN